MYMNRKRKEGRYLPSFLAFKKRYGPVKVHQ